MAILDDWDQARQPGLLGRSPSRNRMLVSGGSGAHQGDSRRPHAELWMTRIVTPPEGKLVARSANNNRFVPTVDQAVLGKDEMAGLDGGPTFRKVGQDWGIWFLAGFASWIEGGNDPLVQIFPDWRDHRWTGRMDLACGKLGDQIGGSPVGDLDYVEAQLFGGGAGWLSLSMGKPGRVRPPITVEAEDDDFP